MRNRMKLLHLSDLHIGKRVNEFSMLEDQKYILQQIIEIADIEQVDGLILAGDIYDKPVPPTEAVQIFDQFLTKLAQRNRKIFIISGNHDSAERIAFGAKLMNSKGVYVSPVYNGNIEPIALKDEYGEIFIYLLPFIKPAVIHHVFPQEDCESYEDAARIAISHMKVNTEKRNILVAHQLVTGADRCDSEEILIGGLDNINSCVFETFDYVALGHIHSPQSITKETIRYCGTPLKYSFSEAGQKKSVTVLEFFEKENIQIRTIPLYPLRDMCKIKGTYLEVTNLNFYKDLNREDYVQITLTDEEDIPDGIKKLRVIYPNCLKSISVFSAYGPNALITSFSGFTLTPFLTDLSPVLILSKILSVVHSSPDYFVIQKTLLSIPIPIFFLLVLLQLE